MVAMAAHRTGATGPEFSLTGIDGRSLALQHPVDRPTFLVFFKNSCPTCRLISPYLERIYQRVQDAPVRFWGISQDDTDATRTFGEEHGLTFPLAPDRTGLPVSSAYRLISVPALLLLEPDGRISWTSTGFVRADLEALNSEFSRRFRIPGAPLFVESDEVPALKPG